MSRHLTATVHVRDDSGEDHMFGPEDEVPSWAVNKIDNPDVWSEPAPSEPEPDLGPDGELKAPAANAGEDKWRAYALRRGIPEDELAGLDKTQIRERVATLPPPAPAE
jgi:hypothetical protein